MKGITFVIAGIRITVWTNHASDVECLEEMFLYHGEKSIAPNDKGNSHDVVITSSRESLNLPADMPLIWTGHIHNTTSVKWYNPPGKTENLILIADEILIRHLPQKNLTICYLLETKSRFFNFHRPQLSNCIFFLLHSITSMYGKYCIHASCVGRQEYAYLFTGQSGSGKTTISEILGKAGWEYMGDDLVFISQNENGETVVDSFLCKAKIFDAGQTTKNTIDVIGKWHFNYAYRKKAGAIVNPQRTEAIRNSTLIPASQTEAFTWLIYAGNNIKIQYHPKQWMNICEKVSFLPAYTLMFADKKYFNPAVLDAVLQ